MKIIITEEQSLFLRRRTEEIKDLVKSALNNVDPEGYNIDEYVTEIVWQVMDHYEDINGGRMEVLYSYVRKEYTKDIIKYYYQSQTS